MARRARALAAINGGFFEPDGAPRGLLKVDGRLLSPAAAGQGSLGIDGEGRLVVEERPAGDWPEMVDALGAGPILLREGAVVDHGPRQREIRHPRSALGVTAGGRLVWLAVDGRNERAAGMSFEETAAVLQALGCQQALNLDGGGSTTLWVAGLGIVNHPSDNKVFDTGGEREVGNALLLFAPALLELDDSEARLVPANGWASGLAARRPFGPGFGYAADGAAREARFTLRQPRPGRYRLSARWPRLTDRPVGWSRLVFGPRVWEIEQRPVAGSWVGLGTLTVGPVEEQILSWQGVAGVPLLVDALRLEQIEPGR